MLYATPKRGSGWLVELSPRLLTYLMSFLTLGIFWVGQNTQHDLLERSERGYAWIHIAFLMAVTLVPFSTSLLAEFIAYRTALKSLRRQKNHSGARSLDDYPEQTTDPTLEAEVQDWLTHGLNQLSIEQRLTLELAYHMGHSLEEIAAITQCPVGTVKARMFHAREKLRSYLPALSGAG